MSASLAARSRILIALAGWLPFAISGCTSHREAGSGGVGTEVGGDAGSGAVAGAGGAFGGGGEVGNEEWEPGPSCRGLPASCGPDHQQDCCASHVVPGGTFSRDNGSAGDFRATLSDFRLDDYEVTVGRFRNFVTGYADHKPAAGSGRNPSNDIDAGWEPRWNDSLPADEAELIESVQVCDSSFTTYAADDATVPMNCITWFQAYAFCIWDGGRLPTDAETNYAAAGGAEQRLFPWSDPPDTDDIDANHAVYLPDAPGPQPVGSKSPLGDGRWGQADLSGNEWEWCQDWYNTYPTRCVNCADLMPDFTIRVIRGGDFYSDRESLYTTSRLYHAPGQADFGVGVRCARAP
jgi:formylglycine-generating enzyme required for sulfatase activity